MTSPWPVAPEVTLLALLIIYMMGLISLFILVWFIVRFIGEPVKHLWRGIKRLLDYD